MLLLLLLFCCCNRASFGSLSARSSRVSSILPAGRFVLPSAVTFRMAKRRNLSTGCDTLTALPDDILAEHILQRLGARTLGAAAATCTAFHTRAARAALAAAETLVPGIGPVAVRVDVDDRQYAVSKARGACGVEHSRPTLSVGFGPSRRLHLRNSTASAWLLHIECQVGWVQWLSEHLAFGKRGPLQTLPFLIPWRADPEEACEQAAKTSPLLAADLGCERALLNLCDAPPAAIALFAVPVVLSLLSSNESPGVFRGSVRANANPNPKTTPHPTQALIKRRGSVRVLLAPWTHRYALDH